MALNLPNTRRGTPMQSIPQGETLRKKEFVAKPVSQPPEILAKPARFLGGLGMSHPDRRTA
jgi:hypothetical protein